jgi:hypothetical protein
MDLNILLQRLQHGDSYTATNAEGQEYQVNTPPTALNLQAARSLIALCQQLEQNNVVIGNLQRQLNAPYNQT